MDARLLFFSQKKSSFCTLSFVQIVGQWNEIYHRGAEMKVDVNRRAFG